VIRSGAGGEAVQKFVEIYSRPSLTWERLPFLRERPYVHGLAIAGEAGVR